MIEHLALPEGNAPVARAVPDGADLEQDGARSKPRQGEPACGIGGRGPAGAEQRDRRAADWVVRLLPNELPGNGRRIANGRSVLGGGGPGPDVHVKRAEKEKEESEYHRAALAVPRVA